MYTYGHRTHIVAKWELFLTSDLYKNFIALSTKSNLKSASLLYVCASMSNVLLLNYERIQKYQKYWHKYNSDFMFQKVAY